MKAHPFSGLDGEQRQAKPRERGLTMVIDWGLGPRAQADLLEVGAEFFDFAKVAVGLSRLLEGTRLAEKIGRYQEAGVEPFPGGQFLEYAQVRGRAEDYVVAACQAGYRCIEVSDNLAPSGPEWKAKWIRRAVEEFGLQVLGEVGRKEGLERQMRLADDARLCLEAGARLVLVEAAELVGADAQTSQQIEEVVAVAGCERVLFELPGPWIEGVNLHDVHRMRTMLVRRYGPEVNLGNISADELLSVEAYRRGLGVNAGHPPP